MRRKVFHILFVPLFLFTIMILFILSSHAEAFDIVSIISPSITQNPVEVIIWVKDGVTPADEVRVLAQIQEGLDMWASVLTSSLAFNIVQVVHSTNQPARQSYQLLIIVGNQADLTSGGASFPSNGNPGIWFGAVADISTIQMRKIAAHEVGHAIGFHHSTISNAFPSGINPGIYPIMHWANATTADQLTADDIAAVSTAYPNPSQPLSNTTGTIRGRLVIKGTTIPVSGVNVVAVNQANGVPAVASLSGPRLTAYGGHPDGEFELVGLSPGTYDIRYLDGHSFRGVIPGIRYPNDYITSGGTRVGYQADNFTEFSSLDISVATGQVVDLGDIGVELWSMVFEGIHNGEFGRDPTFDPAPNNLLPNATVGEPYEIWLHISGGLRDITAQSVGIPAGLTGSISGDPRTVTALKIHGIHFFRINGTPTVPGNSTIEIELTDARLYTSTFTFNLIVEPSPSQNCTDLDSDGYYKEGGDCGPADCDDSNGTIHPGKTETCNDIDDNCDGSIDEGFDEDSDGFTTCEGDCDDTNSEINPSATEICNSKDDDCDGETDEGVLQVFYLDSDGDGFGNVNTSLTGCAQPSGYVTNSTDCDDDDANIFPGASEVCNDIDDDCDTEIDEGVKVTFYQDADSDGYGDVTNPTQACTEPEGYVSDSSDCNDTDATINPGAAEVCNAADDNCDGIADEGVTTTYYLDADNDGYGDISFPIEACTEPFGYASKSTDCNDDDALISPAAAEMCFDQVDNDCDTLTDCDDINCKDELACASDADGDGVPDFLEMGPSGNDATYDGDNNGTPDYEETTAVSCYCYGGGHYVTLSCPMGLANVNVVPIPPNQPGDATFPYGFFEFTIDEIADGASTSVTFYLDDVTNTFYKFGPTIVGTWEPDWYPYLYDAQLKTGAQFDGLSVTVHYVDGAIGDDDLTINGTIVDQGGPGVITSEPTPPSGGGGGGCSIVGLKMSIKDALAGYGLLIVAGVLWGFRRRRGL